MLKMYSESQTPPAEDLEDLLALAGEATEQPPIPPGGIPLQYIPGSIRWPIRLLLLPFILLDMAAQRVAGWLIRSPLKQAGKCLRRGNCCHYILVPEEKGALGKLFYFWNTQFLGFYRRTTDVHESEGKRVYVMGCRYLKKDGTCRHYFLRPAVCRKWPIIEYFGRPRILKGCGFSAIPRKDNNGEVG